MRFLRYLRDVFLGHTCGRWSYRMDGAVRTCTDCGAEDWYTGDPREIDETHRFRWVRTRPGHFD